MRTERGLVGDDYKTYAVQIRPKLFDTPNCHEAFLFRFTLIHLSCRKAATGGNFISKQLDG